MRIFKVISYLVVVLTFTFLFTSAGWCEDGTVKNDYTRQREFNKSLLLSGQKQQQINTNTPSRAKAFLLSFLLPGLGEYYAGSRKMAKIFLGTEVALWTAYACFRIYGGWREDDYKNFAITHAHIDPSGKDHDYFVNIEHYDDVGSYNQAKLQQRDLNALYPENEEYFWKWDSRANRLRYEKIRMSSDRAFSNSVLVIGAVVLNHIVSGIDAMRVAGKTGNKTREISMGFIPVPGGGLQFCLLRNF